MNNLGYTVFLPIVWWKYCRREKHWICKLRLRTRDCLC